MTEPNIPLLRKAVEWVEEQAQIPEIDREWNQQAWFRSPEGTARNIAYQEVAALVRKRYLLNDDELDLVEELTQQLEPHCGTAYCVAGYIGQMHNDGYKNHIIVESVHVSDYARDLLGLTVDQAERLFLGSNTAEDVRRIAEEIAGEPL